MKKNISIQGIFLGAVMLLGMSVSCQDDIEQQGHGASADRILLSIGEGSSVGSRSEAGVWSNRYLMTVGKDSLFVGLTEEVNAVAVESRGASITTGNIESFYLAAYEDDGKTQWVSGNWQKDAEGNTILKDGETNWKFNPDKNWPEDYRALHFHGYAATLGYAFAPTFSIGGSGDNRTYQGTFGYTIPTSQGETKSDATSQPDLIVALTPNQNRKVDVVDIDFYHALSAVIFKAGDMPENTKLQSITLKGVNSTGTCTYTATGSNVPSFKWTSSEPKNYTQTFGSDLKDDTDITTTAHEAAFMMIPQTFSNDAIVSVVVVVNVGDYQRTYKANMKLKDLIPNVTAWEAHHKYTYTLSLKEGVTVDVTDEVNNEGKTKENVVIKNTGESTSFIRAAIVGHWVSDAGVILSPWNINDDDTGKFDGLDNGSWLQGSDGFFYHKAPVAPGKTTDALFNSYKLEATAPIIGAELEFNIVVQAIHKQQVKHSGWPVEVEKENGLLTPIN